MKHAFQKGKGATRRVVSFALVSAMMVSAAQAAHLADVQGRVFVDYGQGFQPAAGSAALGPGDRVKAEQGSAVIVYDGCGTKDYGSVTVRAGQTVVVVDHPSCAPTVLGGLPQSTVIIGGVAIAGGIGLAVGLSNNSNGSPSSP
jgi:hypothetical protein